MRMNHHSDDFNRSRGVVVRWLVLVLVPIAMTTVSCRNYERDVCQRTMLQVLQSLEVYKQETGSYPPEESWYEYLANPSKSGLTKEENAFLCWADMEHAPVDPWNNELVYLSVEGEVSLVSRGPDELLGSDDDIAAGSVRAEP